VLHFTQEQQTTGRAELQRTIRTTVQYYNNNDDNKK